MRPRTTVEAMARRMPGASRFLWAAVALALIAAVSLVRADVDEKSQAAVGAGRAEPAAEGARAAPVLPIVDREVLLRLPRRERDRTLEEAVIPGLVAPGQVWQALPAGASLFDPGNGFFYYPEMSLAQVTITGGSGEQIVAVYYTAPTLAPPSDAVYYRALLAHAMSRLVRPEEGKAEKPGVAPAEEDSEAPGPPPGLVSRLAPMLGGPDRVPLAFVVGETKLRQGKYEEAISAFERSCAGSDDDPTSLLALSIAVTADRGYAGAADLLRRGLRGLKDWHALHVDWAAVFGGEAAARSVEDGLLERLARHGADQEARLVLGFHYFASRRDVAAAEVFRQAGNAGDSLMGELLAAAERRIRAAARADEAAAQP